jgi:predicted RNA-binding protein YlxR (DUF448 family)
MCVVCRRRFSQESMYRLQCKNYEIVSFSGIGRSFYLCKDCENSKNLDKIVKRICKKSVNIEKIKEIIIYEDKN